MYNEQHYGFKRLTIDNILQPDTLGIQCDIKKEQWMSCAYDFLKPQLSETVPDGTKALFEVARGTMVYGLFFFPLYSMGTEQLFRVAENALRQKCIALGMQFKDGKMYFGDMLGRLTKKSVISKDRRQVWECFRQLRNIYSHPGNQTIITPALAEKTLKTITEQINLLFDNK